jgi:hypothetical protein
MEFLLVGFVLGALAAVSMAQKTLGPPIHATPKIS